MEGQIGAVPFSLTHICQRSAKVFMGVHGYGGGGGPGSPGPGGVISGSPAKIWRADGIFRIVTPWSSLNCGQPVHGELGMVNFMREALKVSMDVIMPI